MREKVKARKVSATWSAKGTTIDSSAKRRRIDDSDGDEMKGGSDSPEHQWKRAPVKSATHASGQTAKNGAQENKKAAGSKRKVIISEESSSDDEDESSSDDEDESSSSSDDDDDDDDGSSEVEIVEPKKGPGKSDRKSSGATDRPAKTAKDAKDGKPAKVESVLNRPSTAATATKTATKPSPTAAAAAAAAAHMPAPTAATAPKPSPTAAAAASTAPKPAPTAGTAPKPAPTAAPTAASAPVSAPAPSNQASAAAQNSAQGNIIQLLASTNRALKSEVDKLQSQVASLTETNGTLSARVTELSTAASSFESEARGLRRVNQDLREEKTEIEDRLRSIEQRIRAQAVVSAQILQQKAQQKAQSGMDQVIKEEAPAAEASIDKVKSEAGLPPSPSKAPPSKPPQDLDPPKAPKAGEGASKGDPMALLNLIKLLEDECVQLRKSSQANKKEREEAREDLDKATVKLNSSLYDLNLAKRELEKLRKKPPPPPPQPQQQQAKPPSAPDAKPQAPQANPSVAAAAAAAMAAAFKQKAPAPAAAAPPPVKKNPPPPPTKKAAASSKGPPSLFPNPAMEPPSLAPESNVSSDILVLYLQQSGYGEEVKGKPRDELLALAKTRVGAWEIRRIIACSQQHPPVRGYNMALYNRNPSGASSLYKELMLKVHPDKNPNDTTASSSAFHFLKTAWEKIGKK